MSSPSTCPARVAEGQAHQAMSSPHEPLHPGLSGVTFDPRHSVSAPQEGRPSAGAAGLGEAGADAILMETRYPKVARAASSCVGLGVGGESLSFPLNPATCLRPQGLVGPGRGSLGVRLDRCSPRCLRCPTLTLATSFRSPGLGSPPHSEEGLGSG